MNMNEFELNRNTGTLIPIHSFVYSTNLGRFLQPDPIGTQGGLNLYAYTGNDPVNATDPSGLDTQVLWGLPTLSNPFGHVAVATTDGGVVSIGTGTPPGTSLDTYLTKQSTYRSTLVINIPTDPNQEQAINNRMLNSYANIASGRTPYSVLTNNCATDVAKALDAGNIPRHMGDYGLLVTTPFDVAGVAAAQTDSTFTLIPQGTSSVKFSPK